MLFFGCSKDVAYPAAVGSFEKTYGGAGSDYGRSVSNYGPGGKEYLMAGYSNSASVSNYDFLLIRADSAGTVIWQKYYGGAGDDVLLATADLQDTTFLVAGYTQSFGAGGKDMYVIAVNTYGTMQWSHTYGGSADEQCYGIAQFSNGQRLLTGTTQSFGAQGEDLYLVRTDWSGDTLWTKRYGGPMNDGGVNIHVFPDNSFMVLGYTNSFGNGDTDLWLLRCDANGDTLWTKTIGTPGYEEPHQIKMTPDGNLLITAHTAGFGHPEHNVYLVKIDMSGNILWQNNYGGSQHDGGEWSVIASDGSIYTAARSMSFGNMQQMYLLHTSSGGGLMTERNFGSHHDEAAHSIIFSSPGNFSSPSHLLLFGERDADGQVDFFLAQKPVD